LIARQQVYPQAVAGGGGAVNVDARHGYFSRQAAYQLKHGLKYPRTITLGGVFKYILNSMTIPIRLLH
jgi:hypothetical protein